MSSSDDKILVVLFSRGRGHGHAIPDMAILSELKRMAPNIEVQIVSYATGARTFVSSGCHVIDLGLAENNGFIETLIACSDLLRRRKPDIVIAHEEFAAIAAAKLAGVPSIFVSAWLPQAKSISAEALATTNSIVVIDHPGVFAVPPGVPAKVHYVGPILRQMKYTVRDRMLLRAELGFPAEARVILVVSGGWAAEDRAPVAQTVLSAFQLLKSADKRLMWLAGRDCQFLKQKIDGIKGIEVMEFYDPIERLIALCDVVVTKGTRGITLDAACVGVPSISMSPGLNPIDDQLVPRIHTNLALNARAVDGPILAAYIEKTIDAASSRSRSPIAYEAGGATLAAATIHAEIRRLVN